MHDLHLDMWRRKATIQESLISLISGYGYRLVETPILEGTELFLRQSGGDLASRMYSFVDAGSQQVSLRPEFTSPIMRHYLENAPDYHLPARFQYAGPVFRYDAADSGGASQLTQVGAELIGATEVFADAELVALAAEACSRGGVRDHTIELADLNLFHSILDSVGISNRARSFILASVPQLRSGNGALAAIRERAYQLHLGDRSPENLELSAAIAGLDDVQARQVIQGFLQWNGTDQRRFGQRDPDQVVERFLRKLKGSDEAGQLERALELASSLSCIRGEPVDALKATRELVESAPSNPRPLERFEALLEILQACPETTGRVRVDMGMARGIAYYNGIVFELGHPRA